MSASLTVVWAALFLIGGLLLIGMGISQIALMFAGVR